MIDNVCDISIIVPVYNTEIFLERCLNSIIDQTFTNWQAICINDGSSDSSLKILQHYAQKDKRFVIINQENNGVSAARNVGLKAATGKYIMYLDSDDIIHPKCMEIALKTITDTQTDVCDFGFVRVKEKQNISHVQYDNAENIEILESPLKNFALKDDKSALMFCKKMYKAEIAKSAVFAPIAIGEDILYSFDVFRKVKNYTKISNNLMYYVQRQSSVMHDPNKIRLYQNKLVFTDLLYDKICHFCKQGQLSAEACELWHRYICNKLFRYYVTKPYQLKFSQESIMENVKKLKTKNFNRKALKLRYRIILYLLEHGCWPILRILA